MTAFLRSCISDLSALNQHYNTYVRQMQAFRGQLQRYSREISIDTVSAFITSTKARYYEQCKNIGIYRFRYPIVATFLASACAFGSLSLFAYFKEPDDDTWFGEDIPLGSIIATIGEATAGIFAMGGFSMLAVRCYVRRHPTTTLGDFPLLNP